MNDKRKNILFFGFYVSSEVFSEIQKNDDFPSVQTYKFSESLILALDCNYDISIISAVPVSDYPYSRYRYYPGSVAHSNLPINKTVRYIGFLNSTFFKLITRFFSSLWAGVSSIVSRKPDYIFVYSVHLPFMIVGFFLSKIFRVKLVSVWTDPPAVSVDRDVFLKKKFRAIENCVSRFFMRQFDGSVVLSKWLSEDFNPGKPYLVVESILKEIVYNAPLRKNRNYPVVIVYSGTLNIKYGIGEILKAADLLKYEFVEFHFYGRGDAEDVIQAAVLNNKNIVHHGFLSNDVVVQKQREADFLINIRPCDLEYVKYSFPSKMTEYFSSGTPVIANMLPGMPDEYRDFIIESASNSPQDIATAVKNALNLNDDQRRCLANKAQNFMNTKSVSSRSIQISQFLEGLR